MKKRQLIILTSTTWETGAGTTPLEITVAPEVVLVVGGTFQMGGYVSEVEEPVHRVAISTFYIGKYPVTVRQYRLFCTATGKAMPKGQEGWGADEYAPIVNVAYDDAVGYCDWLCEYYGGDWRLPSEAEWEYAARGGGQGSGCIYSGSDDLSAVGWFGGNMNGRAIVTGRKQPNELGIYDMSGNVWEWCWDWYDPDYYAVSPFSNPLGPVSGTERVLRGGAWDEIPLTCRVACRGHCPPEERRANCGFRVVFAQ